MDFLLKDLRHAARLMLRSRGLSAVSILALTLGIGLTTTMFSIVYGAILRGLPFERNEQILHIETSDLTHDIRSRAATVHEFRDWRAQQKSFEDIAAFHVDRVNVRTADRPEPYSAAFITPEAFGLLRVRPLLGRVLQPGEDGPGAAPVAVIGYKVWQERFGGDAGVVGRTLRINGQPTTIVGVMDEKFRFPFSESIWLPLDTHAERLSRGRGPELEVFGRVHEKVTPEQALAELSAIQKRIEIANPAEEKGIGIIVKPFIEEYIGPQERALLWTMLAAVAFVLLIACANVANLLLGRAVARTREVGIRTALGASRWRVLAQFLSEAFVLALAGAILGLGIAWIGIRLFNSAISGTGAPFFIDIRLDTVPLAFSLLLVFVTAAIAGLLPAWQAARADINEVLKDESRGASSFRIGRMSRAIVVLEIALSCGLLVGAGLTVKSIAKLRTFRLPIPAHEMLAASVLLPQAVYPDSTRQVQFIDALDARLETINGARNAVLASAVPEMGAAPRRVAIDGVSYKDAESRPLAQVVATQPGLFDMIDIELEEGRDFAATDRPGSERVAIVSRLFVDKLMGGGSAIGRRITVGETPYTIVGVTREAYAAPLPEKELREAVYVPLAQAPGAFVWIMLRSGNPSALTSSVRDAVQSIDPDLPISQAKTVDRLVNDRMWFYRVFGSVFFVFGMAALLLASIGLYAVMAFSVRRRTREVGIRMAIGAQPADVMRLIVRQGLGQVLLGMIIGLAFAAAVSRFVATILFQVQPNDPAIFAAIVLLLSAVALAACVVPARRAMRVDPNVALRYE